MRVDVRRSAGEDDMTMSTPNLETHFDLAECEENLVNWEQCEKNVPNPKSDLDTKSVFSVSSSQFAKECPLETGETNDAKLNGLFSERVSDQLALTVPLLNVSPLESIRELVEVEAIRERRSPGDGGVPIKDDITSKEAFGNSILGNRASSPNGGFDFVNPESSKPESSSSHEVPVGSWLQEDASHVALSEGQQVEWWSSSVVSNQKEMAGRCLTPCNDQAGVLSLQLDTQVSVTLLQDLENLKEEHDAHQTATELQAKPTEQTEIASEKNSERFHSPNLKKEDMETAVVNQNLIEVLTACKTKVEQLEELRSCSFHLSDQLESAKLMAARLHQKVLYLEYQHSLKERELQELNASLEKTSEALKMRNIEMARVNTELHQLRVELETREKNLHIPANTNTANGQTRSNSQQTSPNSKVCTLF